MTKESVKNNETLIEINARMFASAASIAPVSDFRHYLNGIHIYYILICHYNIIEI